MDELRQIGRGCIIRHLFHHYRGFAVTKRQDLVTVKDLLYAYRVYLTGIHVLWSGVVEANLSVLNGEYPVDGLDELIERKRAGGEHGRLSAGEASAHEAALDRLGSRLEEAFASSRLPDEPTTVAELDAYVIRARMELGGG